MTTAQVVETSVTVNNNSPIQDYVHPDDHTQLTYVLDWDWVDPQGFISLHHRCNQTPASGICKAETSLLWVLNVLKKLPVVQIDNVLFIL